MSDEIFLDTMGLYSLMVTNDSFHEKAKKFLRSSQKAKRTFWVTDYVLDETAMLLKYRNAAHLISPLFDRIEHSKALRLYFVNEPVFWESREFFQKHIDHGYSFTDCTSFMVMKILKINQALTHDRHFTEAGFQILLS